MSEILVKVMPIVKKLWLPLLVGGVSFVQAYLDKQDESKMDDMEARIALLESKMHDE